MHKKMDLLMTFVICKEKKIKNTKPSRKKDVEPYLYRHDMNCLEVPGDGGLGPVDPLLAQLASPRFRRQVVRDKLIPGLMTGYCQLLSAIN